MSQIQYLTDAVKQMKPGQEMQFARDLMNGAAPPPWTVPDWILEGIMGAAYEYSWRRDEVTGNIIFRRREMPFTTEQGLRTYVAPDRMHYVTKRHDGVYELRSQSGAEAPGGGGGFSSAKPSSAQRLPNAEPSDSPQKNQPTQTTP